MKKEKNYLYYLKKSTTKYTHIFKNTSSWNLCFRSWDSDTATRKVMRPTSLIEPLCPVCKKKADDSELPIAHELDLILGLYEN